jgi:hypothetical protein
MGLPQWAADAIPIFWHAAEAFVPQEVALRRTNDNAIKRAGFQELTELWESAGLREVRTARLELAMPFSSFDDYWKPFLAGATPTSAFAANLNRETDNQLEQTVRFLIPNVQADGSFVLPARALAVAGVKLDAGISSSGLSADEGVTEHFELARVRPAFCPTERVNRWADPNVHETAILDHLLPGCTRQTTGDSGRP